MADFPLLSARLRLVTLTTHGALLLVLPLTGGVPGAVFALPLLLPLRGLWLGRPYTYAWCGLLLALYLGAFLMEAFSQPQRRSLALGLAAVALGEFFALMLFVRARAVERRRAEASRIP